MNAWRPDSASGPSTRVPVSALLGDNVARRSERWEWYRGPTLLELLETIDLADDANTAAAPLRFAVQYVDKAGPAGGGGARRYLGRVGAGTVRPGQAVRILPAGTVAHIAAIETFDGPLSSASAGHSVALRLDRELDVSRGDWLVDGGGALHPREGRLLCADVAWLDRAPLAPQRRLWLRHGTRFLLARVRRVESVLDLETGAWSAPASETLHANDIGRVVIETQQPLPFDSYDAVQASGSAILIDAATQHTVAACMLRDTVRG